MKVIHKLLKAVRYNIHMVHKVGYNALLRQLLDNKYRDISDKRIGIQILACDNPEMYDFRVTTWSNQTHDILGTVPRDLLEDQTVLRGMIGHELSHIVLNIERSRRIVYQVVSQEIVQQIVPFIPIIGPKLKDAREKAVDRETIRRGLGYELYCSRIYWEKLRSSENTQDSGYTGDQIKSLIFESV